MWPNGETSWGFFNGNEYTIWAQGGMGGGSRDQTGEEGEITTVCGKEEEGGMLTVCVQAGWQKRYLQSESPQFLLLFFAGVSCQFGPHLNFWG